MLSLPSILYHVVIWMGVSVFTNGKGPPVWPQQISSTRNVVTQRLNAAQHKTSNTTPAHVPVLILLQLPRRRQRLPGWWNRRRFHDTTPDPNAATTTISNTDAARRRKIEDRRQQRLMLRRQRIQAREKTLLDKLKDKTDQSPPSPSSSSQNMLPIDITDGDQNHSTNSSVPSSKSRLSSLKKQKRNLIEDFRKKQVQLDARIAATKRDIEIMKLKEIRKGQANNQTSSLIDTINANKSSQINLANSDEVKTNASLPQAVKVFTVTEASVTPQTNTQMTIEIKPLPLVNQSDARLGLENLFLQTHTIADIGVPLVPGTKVAVIEGKALGIPLHFIPINSDTFMSTVENPGTGFKENQNPLPTDPRNSLQREVKTPNRFWPPRLAVKDKTNKGQSFLDIGHENPAAGHGNDIPLVTSGTVGIKDIKQIREPLGLPKSGSPSPIQSGDFLTSLLGGFHEHIQFHQTHERHGSSEPLQPPIGHPGEPLEPSIGHPGESLPPLIGHHGELKEPFIIHHGEPLDPSIAHPGEPLSPSIGHPRELIDQSIAHPGEPIVSSIAHPVEPLDPSLVHTGKPLSPFSDNINAIETLGNQKTTGASDQSSSKHNEGVPIQLSLGQSLGELTPGEPLGLGNEWMDISLGVGQPVTEFQDVDFSTSVDSDGSAPSGRQSGIQTINGGFLPRIRRPQESTSSVSGEQTMTSGTQLSQIMSGISSNIKRP